jgi:Zn-dependent peptidase ImmA (M78 family)
MWILARCSTLPECQRGEGQVSEQLAVAREVLVWARKSALATVAEAAECTGQPDATILDWEAGRAQPTFSQLERLANEYGVSANVLLLPAAPHIPQPPPDFRSPGGHEPISRVARRELRRARHLQSLLAEVQVLPPQALPTFPPGRGAAETIRGALGITVAEQLAWKSPERAFGAWRTALGRLGILVLQYRLPHEELQGLSLPAVSGGPPVIFVNQGDWINARVFTLIHELGHLILARDGGICDPWRFGPRVSSQPLEGRCNELAGAVLVPGEHLLGQSEARQIAAEPSDAEVIRLLGSLGNRYRVSTQVVWYRIHDVGLVSDARFAGLWPQLRRPPIRTRPTTDDDERGGIPRWKLATSRYGPQLVGGLIAALDRGALEPTRVLRALSLGTGDLAKLQAGGSE